MKLAQEKGSLLIEALLSVIILSVCITLVVQSMTSSLKAAVYTGDYIKAMFIMDGQMNQLIRKGFIDANVRQKRKLSYLGNEFDFELTSEPMALEETEKINLATLDLSWKSGRKGQSLKTQIYLFDPIDE